MKQNQKGLKEKVISKGDSATILISHPNLEDQLAKSETFVRQLLEIPLSKPYKSFPDVFGIWPENIEGKSIKINQAHEFIRKLQLKPFSSKYKVGIITQAELLTHEAQSALLKSLEEPPRNTFILLTTRKKDLLLPTIISRSQVYEFEENQADDFDQKAIQDILTADILERFSLVEELIKNKNVAEKHESIDHLLIGLLRHFRKSILSASAADKKTEKLLEYIELIESTQRAIEKNVNIRLALESLIINLPQY